MINIYNHLSHIINSGNTTATVDMKTIGQTTLLIYVDYIKGTETDLKLSFEVFHKRIGQWFPLQIENGTSIYDYIITLTDAGKYRIPIAVAFCEDKLRITAALEGDLTTPGSADIWVSGASLYL